MEWVKEKLVPPSYRCVRVPLEKVEEALGDLLPRLGRLEVLGRVAVLLDPLYPEAQGGRRGDCLPPHHVPGGLVEKKPVWNLPQDSGQGSKIISSDRGSNIHLESRDCERSEQSWASAQEIQLAWPVKHLHAQIHYNKVPLSLPSPNPVSLPQSLTLSLSFSFFLSPTPPHLGLVTPLSLCSSWVGAAGSTATIFSYMSFLSLGFSLALASSSSR